MCQLIHGALQQCDLNLKFRVNLLLASIRCLSSAAPVAWYDTLDADALTWHGYALVWILTPCHGWPYIFLELSCWILATHGFRRYGKLAGTLGSKDLRYSL